MAPEYAVVSERATILVVEDEVLIRLLIADELRDAGFVVIEAACADEAVSLFATGMRVDLVFTDVRMPGDLTGLDLARELSVQQPSLPVIITSGNVTAQDAHGLGLFVSKPYELSRVVCLIEERLGLSVPGSDG
ncbi:MAG: response regulator [Sphingobium sp.]|uniref:response regulator n=1 Tax=Sphingobium sp. TaxID=1912891 RepID=UPI0029ACCB27|nr:response regulator [Sphingobium sp.]MDX3911146.1 response regulator [Sphingobium sp.]